MAGERIAGSVTAPQWVVGLAFAALFGASGTYIASGGNRVAESSVPVVTRAELRELAASSAEAQRIQRAETATLLKSLIESQDRTSAEIQRLAVAVAVLQERLPAKK